MEIEKGVYRILRGKGPVPSSNVYLVEGEELMLIDSGLPTGVRLILERVSKLGYDPRDVSTLALTHFHLDHSGGAFEIKKRTNAEIAVHPADADFVSGKKKPSFKLRAIAKLFKCNPVEPDILVGDGDELCGLSVLHTPGHTQGSICLYDPKRKILFAGDALRISRNRVKGPSKISSVDLRRAAQSVKKISGLDFDILLPGHGDPLMPNASQKLRESLK